MDGWVFKQNRTSRTLHRSKLKQFHHHLSYSAPPGVSWPLGNFLLNYPACRHLWSIMTLSPLARCCREMKASSYRSNQSVIPFTGATVKDVTSIRFSAPFKMQPTNNSVLKFWNVKEHKKKQIEKQFNFTLLSRVRLSICFQAFFVIKGLYYLLH